MAAHRYWRIYATSVNSGGLMGADEVYFRATPGGKDLCGTGVPFASSEYSRPEYQASNAFNRTYRSVFATATGAPCWLGYDFQTPVEVQEVEWQARDLGGQSPNEVQLQWSDDGSKWTTVAFKAWGSFRNMETKRINVVQPSFPKGVFPHRHWAIQCDTNLDGTYWSLVQMELRATPGGLDLTDYNLGSIYFTGNGSDAYAAIDNVDYRVPNTAYTSPLGTQFRVDFGNGKAFTIAEMTMRARNDGYFGQTPRTGKLLWSDDGTTYTEYCNFAFGPWSQGQTQTATFSDIKIPPGASPVRRRIQVCVT